MNKAKKIIIFILMLSFVFQISFSYEKPKKITFTTPIVKINSTAKWLTDIYTEAFSRMGIEFSVELVPGNRAIQLVADGEYDGELERVYSYQDKHPYLIRVSENSRKISFSAYSFDNTIKLDGWDSLINTNYNVGYRLGVKLPETKLASRISRDKISATREIDSAMRKLVRNRINIYIDIQDYVEKFKKSPRFANYKTLYKVGIMEEISVHAYLHKKHTELEAELSQILADMKEEGVFREYLEKYNENFDR